MVATIGYDAFGRRQTKVTATARQYLYDGLNPVQELTGATPPGVTANLLTGLRIDEYFTRTDSTGIVSTLLRDALGSTVGLVGQSNTIATSYAYQPFGATTVSGAANGNVYQFTGRENDGSPGGLYYYRARYYNPTYQRFVAQDPIDFRGGLNLYSYVGNSPLNFSDWWGLCGGQPEPQAQPQPEPTPPYPPPGPLWPWPNPLCNPVVITVGTAATVVIATDAFPRPRPLISFSISASELPFGMVGAKHAVDGEPVG